MREFIIAALDDENGINEKAYNELLALQEIASDFNEDFSDILAAVRATDGRYYLPENHGLK